MPIRDNIRGLILLLSFSYHTKPAFHCRFLKVRDYDNDCNKVALDVSCRLSKTPEISFCFRGKMLDVRIWNLAGNFSQNWG